MNATEQAAHAWLRRKGYAPDAIAHKGTHSPDFTTPDGVAWEIKRLAGSVATFTAAQLIALLAYPDARILLFKPGEAAPVAVVPFRELVIPGTWGDFTLRLPEPTSDPREYTRQHNVLCRICGERPARSRGLCAPCYSRQWRAKAPAPKHVSERPQSRQKAPKPPKAQRWPRLERDERE